MQTMRLRVSHVCCSYLKSCAKIQFLVGRQCKEGQQAMNRNEGSYQLSHVYTAAGHRIKSEELSKIFLLMNASERGCNVKGF